MKFLLILILLNSKGDISTKDAGIYASLNECQAATQVAVNLTKTKNKTVYAVCTELK